MGGVGGSDPIRNLPDSIQVPWAIVLLVLLAGGTTLAVIIWFALTVVFLGMK